MGKRNRNRYASSNPVSNYRQQVKSKALKAKNPQKYKKQKQINKMMSDGKIDKKEGQKAAKKGISLQKIQNQNINQYRNATSDFDRGIGMSQGRNPAAKRPVYEPLKIKRGAIQAEQRGSSRNNNKKNRNKKDNRKVRSTASSTPTSNYAAEAKTTLADIDQDLNNILNPGEDAIDPITFQYAASSLVEPGNNLTIGAATDPSKTTGSDNFKRRGKKRKKNRLLRQIGKGKSQLGGFSGPAPSAAGAAASSAFGGV